MTESLPPPSPDTEKLRDSLVAVTLKWERVFGEAGDRRNVTFSTIK